MNNILTKFKNNSHNLYLYINKKLWLFTLLTTLIVVSTGIFISIESNRLVKPNIDPASHYHLENNPLKHLANWDGADYISIANKGYDDKFLTGFFPLYPILIKLVHVIVRSYLISGLIITWLALWGAIYFYVSIVKEYYSRSNTKIKDNLTLIKSALYFVLFPSGIYLLCVYTESLYALFALAAINFAYKKKLVLTTLLTILATAAHITGFFLIPIVVLMLFEEKVSKIKSLAVGAIGSIGIIAYLIYLWIKFNNPFEFVHSQTVHHWLKNKIWYSYDSISILDLFLLISLITTVIYWYKRKRSFSFYTLLFIAIPLIGGQFDGFARYTLMAFPMQLMFFDYLKNKIESQFISLMILSSLWTYSVILFAAGFVTH